MWLLFEVLAWLMEGAVFAEAVTILWAGAVFLLAGEVDEGRLGIGTGLMTLGMYGGFRQWCQRGLGDR